MSRPPDETTLRALAEPDQDLGDSGGAWLSKDEITTVKLLLADWGYAYGPQPELCAVSALAQRLGLEQDDAWKMSPKRAADAAGKA